MPTPAPPPADLMSSLLRRYQARGCPASFERLVRHYSPLVEKTARQLLNGDAEAARDVAQRVFTDFARLGRESSRVRADGPPAGWLHRHTVFLASHYRTAEERRRRREAEYSRRLPGGGEEGLARAVEQAAAMHRLVERLPEADRHIILARFWDEQNLRDIGAALGLSEDAAQKRLSRALEKLRVRLGVPRGKQMAAALGAWLGVSSSVSAGTALPSGGAASGLVNNPVLPLGLMAVTTEKVVRWTLLGCLLLGASGGVHWWQHYREKPQLSSGSSRQAVVLEASGGPPPRPSSLSNEEVSERADRHYRAFAKAKADYFLSHPNYSGLFKEYINLRESLSKEPYYQKFMLGEGCHWVRNGAGAEAVKLLQMKEMAESFDDVEKSSLINSLSGNNLIIVNFFKKIAKLKDAGEIAKLSPSQQASLFQENMTLLDDEINSRLQEDSPGRPPGVFNEQLKSYAKAYFWERLYANYFFRNEPENVRALRGEWMYYSGISDNRYRKDPIIDPNTR